jgi:hypothetical protein
VCDASGARRKPRPVLYCEVFLILQKDKLRLRAIIGERDEHVAGEVNLSAENRRPASEKKNFDKPWKLQGVKFECRVCGQMFFDRKEASACFDGHFEPEKIPLRPASEKKNFTSPWKLQGVKFECRVCGKMFFDRAEAKTCFDGHFDAGE